MSKPYCVTARTWLKENQGPRCFAGFTSQDAVAFDAVVQLAALWQYTRREVVAVSFGETVRLMQGKYWHLAFHVVAHIGNWEDRAALWSAAGFEDLPDYLTLCNYEPGGPKR